MADDNLIQGSFGVDPIGTTGTDLLEARPSGLFGMSPQQQQMALMMLGHLGQTIQAYGSRGRIAPPPFPIAAIASLMEGQRRDQEKQDALVRVARVADSIQNNPDVPEATRTIAAEMARAGSMAGVDAIVEGQARRAYAPRYQEPRNIEGNIVALPADGVGAPLALGRAAERWEPDPARPGLLRNAVTMEPMAVPLTAADRIAMENAQADRADERADRRDAAAAKRSEANQAATNERFLARQTDEFAGKLAQGKLPTLLPAINKVNSLLTDYVETDENGNPRVVKPIPGVGPLTDSRGAPIAMSEEGKRNRAAITAVINNMLALYSGLTVTETEALRRTQEMMSSGVYTDQDFVNAWKSIIDHYNGTLRTFKAGYGQDVVRRYSSQPDAPYLGDIQPFRRGYSPLDTIKGKDGKLYRVVGTDLYNPEVEPVK